MVGGMVGGVDSLVSNAFDEQLAEMRRRPLAQAVMCKRVSLNGNRVRVADLPDGYYNVALKLHGLFNCDRVSGSEGVANRIAERSWQDEPVKLETADYPYMKRTKQSK